MENMEQKNHQKTNCNKKPGSASLTWNQSTDTFYHCLIIANKTSIII